MRHSHSLCSGPQTFGGNGWISGRLNDPSLRNCRCVGSWARTGHGLMSDLSPLSGVADVICSERVFPVLTLNAQSVGLCRVQERFWSCQSVPMRRVVLAYFNP